MGWKGFVRSVNSSIKAAERDSRRRQRALEKQQIQEQRMEEREQAALEVEIYENYIDRLVSVHKEYSDRIDWNSVKDSQPPSKPTRQSVNEEKAKTLYETYKPGMVDKLLKRTDKRKEGLYNDIDKGRNLDDAEYNKAIEEFETATSDWEDSTKLAARLLDNDKDAYLEVIQELNAFAEIAEIGSSLNFIIGESRIIEASLNVHGEEVIPNESKSLLRSGNVSVKKMPLGKYYELYQDYICSCVLRVANELFSVLPVNSVVATAIDNLLNSSTGHIEEQPILSVAIPRATLETLNLDVIDPSDSMRNFVHNMNFKKTKGFAAVEKLSPDDLQLDK